MFIQEARINPIIIHETYNLPWTIFRSGSKRSSQQHRPDILMIDLSKGYVFILQQSRVSFVWFLCGRKSTHQRFDDITMIRLITVVLPIAIRWYFSMENIWKFIYLLFLDDIYVITLSIFANLKFHCTIMY